MMVRNPRRRKRLVGNINIQDIYLSSIQKKNVASEYYDTTDPFIDDSELAVDERQFFAQTKQQGFYVSSGEVALLKDKYVFSSSFFPNLFAQHRYRSSRTPKKPKSKKISFAHGLQKSIHLSEDIKETTIPIDSDDKRLKMEDPSTISLVSDGHAGQKRKRQNSTSEGGKRKKMIDEVCSVDFLLRKKEFFIWILFQTMFHPELQVAIKGIKELVAQGNKFY